MSYQETIISAAKREDLIIYFRNLCNSDKSNKIFQFDSDLVVELHESRPNPIAPIIIHTPVKFIGPKHIVDKMINDFRMKFLTAGG